MRTQFSVDINVRDKDIFEQEVLNAMRAYAKEVSREAMNDEIQKEINRLVENHTKTYANTTWFTPGGINAIIKGACAKSIDDVITKSYDEIVPYIRGEIATKINRIFNESAVKRIIDDEIKKQVPEYIVNAIRKSMENYNENQSK